MEKDEIKQLNAENEMLKKKIEDLKLKVKRTFYEFFIVFVNLFIDQIYGGEASSKFEGEIALYLTISK